MNITNPAPVPSRRGWRPLAGVILAGGVMLIVWAAQRSRTRDPDEVIAPWTTAAAREESWRQTRDGVIQANLEDLPPIDQDGKWQQLLNAAKWQAERSPGVLAAVRRRLTLPVLPPNANAHAVETARLALETAYALFPRELEPEMRRIFLSDHDPKRLGMAGAWLARFDPGAENRAMLASTLLARFPDADAEPRLLGLLTALREPRIQVIAQRPALTDLLKAPFACRPVIFSFQRVNRSWPGRAVVRHVEGGFLVEPDGRPFSVTQFARSASDLPGTLTNGNTPCGIFEIVETAHTDNKAIGPSPTLVLGLPLEYDAAWTVERYQGLLPASWQNWWPVREAWWAGLAGRNEILAHGTTIDPRPWLDTVFAGQTPSHGCLTCEETWDPDTGRRTSSEQVRLAEAFRKAGGAPGYLVVVEIDDTPCPVPVDEVTGILEQGL